MEQNMPIIAKKFWKVVRVAYFMVRKGISKGKILADLNAMMKRGKIAGKLEAIHNLMFHHHHHHCSSSASASASDLHLSFPVSLHEYEFSCSNSPANRTFHLPSFHFNKRKHSHKAQPSPHIDDEAEMMAEALEMINSAAASPALPGFGPTPNVRQLRITDSPYPLKDDFEEDNHVDEAAEEFISRFYKDLKRQNASTSSSNLN